MQDDSLSIEADKIDSPKLLPSEQKRQVWKKIIADWEKSNVSQRVFCESRDLDLRRFVYYRGSFRKASGGPRKMIPIQMSTDSIQKAAIANQAFTFYLRNNIKLTIPETSDTETLKNVFYALGVLP